MIAAARGGEVDRRPTIAWPLDPLGGDAIVVPVSDVARMREPHAERMLLAEVVNPFGASLQRRVGLNEALERNPEDGGLALDALVSDVRGQMRDALDAGADGVLYRLHGARGRHCSPMQYGGFYLERDRELLDEIHDAALNVLFVVGDDDAYLDFVSDLPAHIFAWDRQATGVSAAEIRQMRSGALASCDPDSEIDLACDAASIAELLEKTDLGTSV
jgi:hypothetical protein